MRQFDTTPFFDELFAYSIRSDQHCVIVVDIQNGFCHPDGSLYAPGSEDSIEPVNEVTEMGRVVGASIFFTRKVHPSEQFDSAHYYDEF